ncbi:MAG: hypothetical protein HYX86_04690 [Chloroflexi bacterium]|nr:hypothetical protein [Chloroflexota bacterium]
MLADIRETPQTREFRELIFDLYGFTPEAQEHIRRNSRIVVNEADPVKAGYWYADKRIVYLTSFGHEAAVHELSHVWWHDLRLKDRTLREELVRDLVRVSDMDPQEEPKNAPAIKFSLEYVYGIPERGWKGMLANAHYNDGPMPQNVHHLTPEDFEDRVNDWEIYAGFSSWTMGRFRDGPRHLPEFMWRYFEPQFKGIIKAVPYYEGGHF